MTQKTVITYYSDLSGAAIDEHGLGVPFGLDGISYEIDLTANEHNALRDALEPFIAASRKAPTQRIRRAEISTRTEPSEGISASSIRQWGRENGFDVPSRGRIPELVREAYQSATSSS